VRYKFKIQEEDKEIEEKEGMSYKKILKSRILNTSKSNGRKTLYKSRSFTKFVLNGGLDKK